MSQKVYIGLAVTSHDPSRFATASISNLAITGSVLPDGPFSSSKDIYFEIPQLIGDVDENN